MKIILSILLMLLTTAVFSQQQKSVNVPLQAYYTPIVNNTKYCFSNLKNLSVADIELLAFKPLAVFKDRLNVPATLVDKNLYLTFSVKNETDTSRLLHLYTGYLTASSSVFSKFSNGTVSKLQHNNQKAYLPLVVPAKTTMAVYVHAVFCKRKNNAIEPILVSEKFSDTYNTLQNNTGTPKKTISFFLIGSLAMMMLYNILNFLVLRNIAFLSLFGGAFALFLMMFFSVSIGTNPTPFKLFFAGYADFILFISGVFFLIQFIRNFLSSEKNYPTLDRYLLMQAVAIIIYGCLFTIIYYGIDNFQIQNVFENLVKVQLIFTAAVFTWYTLKKKEASMQYLALGAASLLFFSSISFFLPFFTVNIAGIFQSPIVYFETGVIFTMAFFIIAIATQNKVALISGLKAQVTMKLAAEKKAFETQLEILKARQEERARISEDMHDDLGAGITAMRLYSEMAKEKLGDNAYPEISKISDAADELLIKLNAIIWSTSTANDSLHNLIAYARAYATDYLEENKITATIKMDEHIPNIIVQGKIRRNIFLVIKEALHNTVKHAGATNVAFALDYTVHSITLSIHDNGIGIPDVPSSQFSNGLQNMRRRMEAYGIVFTIKNENGTLILLTLHQENLFSLENTKAE